MSDQSSVTMEDLNRHLADGYTFEQALSLAGIRAVDETHEEWLHRTSNIMLRHNLGSLINAQELIARATNER